MRTYFSISNDQFPLRATGTVKPETGNPKLPQGCESEFHVSGFEGSLPERLILTFDEGALLYLE